MEAAYEEQLGGVDSELLERRREHGGARSDPGATPLDGGPRPAPHVTRPFARRPRPCRHDALVEQDARVAQDSTRTANRLRSLHELLLQAHVGVATLAQKVAAVRGSKSQRAQAAEAAAAAAAATATAAKATAAAAVAATIAGGGDPSVAADGGGCEPSTGGAGIGGDGAAADDDDDDDYAVQRREATLTDGLTARLLAQAENSLHAVLVEIGRRQEAPDDEMARRAVALHAKPTRFNNRLRAADGDADAADTDTDELQAAWLAERAQQRAALTAPLRTKADAAALRSVRGAGGFDRSVPQPPPDPPPATASFKGRRLSSNPTPRVDRGRRSSVGGTPSPRIHAHPPNEQRRPTARP